MTLEEKAKEEWIKNYLQYSENAINAYLDLTHHFNLNATIAQALKDGMQYGIAKSQKQLADKEKKIAGLKAEIGLDEVTIEEQKKEKTGLYRQIEKLKVIIKIRIRREKALKAQIDKMKCCGNCEYDEDCYTNVMQVREPCTSCGIPHYKNWQLKEN